MVKLLNGYTFMDNFIKTIIDDPVSESSALKIYINLKTNKPYISLGKCKIPEMKEEGLVLKDLSTHENFTFSRKFIDEKFKRAKLFGFGG